MKYDFVTFVITSGGPKALYSIIDKLDKSFEIPIIIVQNLPVGFDLIFSQVFQEKAQIPIEIVDKEIKFENKIFMPKSGTVIEITGKKEIKAIESEKAKKPIYNFIKSTVEKRMKTILVFLSGLLPKEDLAETCKLAKENNIPIIVQNIEENPNLVLKFEVELPKKLIDEKCYTMISNLDEIPIKIKELFL